MRVDPEFVSLTESPDRREITARLNACPSMYILRMNQQSKAGTMYLVGY
jgi:hypothetical protein